jgi:hypothetical protein
MGSERVVITPSPGARTFAGGAISSGTNIQPVAGARTFAGGATSSGTNIQPVAGARTFAGGATSSGTNIQPVATRAVDPGVPGGTSQDLTHPVGLEGEDWSCPWRPEAESADIGEQVVLLRAVGADECVRRARTSEAIGHQCRRCAFRWPTPGRRHPATVVALASPLARGAKERLPPSLPPSTMLYQNTVPSAEARAQVAL